MSKDYIVIADSIPIRSKRFRVIQGGFKHSQIKHQTINETIDGGLDICNGSVYERLQYVFRLRETEDDSRYGTKGDLEYFFSLVNPSPAEESPSNLLTLTDHFGNTKYGYLVGDLVPEPVTTIITGNLAWYMVPVEIRIKP